MRIPYIMVLVSFDIGVVSCTVSWCHLGDVVVSRRVRVVIGIALLSSVQVKGKLIRNADHDLLRENVLLPRTLEPVI